MVEVGVWEGETSARVIGITPQLKKLILVDPWDASLNNLPDHKCRMGRKDPRTQGEMDEMYQGVVDRFGRIPDDISTAEIVIIRASSVVASAKVDKVDMVFIDANHNYPSIRTDILVWKDKCRIIAGHDWSNAHPGVKKAVPKILPNYHTGGHHTWWAKTNGEK